MKKVIIAAFAAAAISTVAYAADLPRTDIAPELPVAVSSEIQHVVSGSLSTNFDAGEYSDSTGLDYTLDYKYLGLGNGVAVGGSIVSSSSSSFEDFDAKRVEADIKWATPSGFGFSTNIGGGLGYRLDEEDTYYKLSSGIDYQVNDFVTFNAVNYQFRDNFDNTWLSHEVGTGVTVAVVENVNVTAKVSRSYDEDLDAVSDTATLGVSFGF